MNSVKLQSVQCIRDHGGTTVMNFKSSQQCRDAAGERNRMLGFIYSIFLFQEIIIKFFLCTYISLIRAYLKYAAEF